MLFPSPGCQICLCEVHLSSRGQRLRGEGGEVGDLRGVGGLWEGGSTNRSGFSQVDVGCIQACC